MHANHAPLRSDTGAYRRGQPLSHAPAREPPAPQQLRGSVDSATGSLPFGAAVAAVAHRCGYGGGYHNAFFLLTSRVLPRRARPW